MLIVSSWEFIATLPPLGPLPLNFTFTMPERTHTTPPITLVLDIDETLVHCATRPLDSPDIVFPVEYNHETWEVYGRIRPGMQEFLAKMSTMFEVITFTASQECYAEALLKIIDPEKKYIRHRYYRDSCVPVFGNYVKDLRILNRDLSKVIIIDNSPQAFGYQISNGIPIESWYDDKADRELFKVMSFLETIGSVEDVRPKIDEHYRLQEKIQKALAQAAAAQQQLASMSGLGVLGSSLTSPSASTSLNAGTAPLCSSSATVGELVTAALESCNSTGANSLASLQSIVPDNADMDATMMMYEEAEKPPSPSDEDDEREEDGEKCGRGRKGRSKAGSGVKGGGTMTTRSNGLDAPSLAQISL
ncbi:HAD-like domain-containing protein [Gamsiella multidivaricata]|uniref:HAD-like domain-containing protein n=1 Tax=Gamsiella multidivaricata TaxID=101098 RepID=UPI00221E46CD|nr:HAD-like domain-containing protein [Gamsiella multidivaricata]KAI7819990.1 HAD-like domain-containing protein [Gamsiella multidivaricata]